MLSANKVFAVNDSLNQAINVINQARIDKGLKTITEDTNLCSLSQLLAEDREKAYPDKIDDNLFSNQKYKIYLKDYSNYSTALLTLNDILIEAYKNKGRPIPFFSKEQVAEQSIASGQALDPNISNGCVAISSGKSGYKQYGYFIGGVKKETLSYKDKAEVASTNNGFWGNIMAFIRNIISKLHFQ